MTILAPPQRVFAFRVVLVILVLAAALSFVALWAPLVLAAWVARIARPLLARFSRATGGRNRAAGALVVLLVVLLVAPLGLAVVSLVTGATQLMTSVLHSDGARSALVAVAAGGQAPEGGEVTLSTFASPEKVVALVQQHGAQAAHILGRVAGAASNALLALFVFFYAVYVFLVDGAEQYDWIEKHAPLEVDHTRRLVDAFHETGRGLFVGVGLTGLAQGVVATTAYLALGVPRALVLGMITCVASLIPSVGTALVWAPVAAGLAFSGRSVKAGILAAIGVFVIGAVDNLLRPVFARFGQLELSSFVLLTSIFGGLAIFGGWGVLLGPLFVRLAKEALIIGRADWVHDKRREVDAAAAEPAPHPPSS